jgi:hypothetical protein
MSSLSAPNRSASVGAICDDEAGTYLERIVDEAIPADGPGLDRIEGAVVGTVVDLAGTGEPLVNFPANRSGRVLAARSTVPLGKGHIGADLVLLFENGDPQKPLVTGVLQNPTPAREGGQPRTFGLRVDDDRVVVTGDREIVLSCGEASITLTRAGKVLIRGTYVITRSSGVNRIKGGSVQIN